MAESEMLIDPFLYCFHCMNMLSERNGTCSACGKDNKVRNNANGELPFSFLNHKRYTVGRSLGRGGFGITYVGLNNRLGKRVAIKEYFPANIAERDPEGYRLRATAQDTDDEFERGKLKALTEARTIASVEGIPNIVRIYDVFARNNTVYIVMEFIEGETLASRVGRQGPMRWNEAWSLMRPVGQTLDLMHDKNLVHRDISPDNIMIRKDNGESVLLDFGAASAKLLDGRKHANLLKAGYAAIEQYREDSIIDGRTDEYSWAATLYFTITGRQPETSMERSYNPGCTPLPRKLRSDIPKGAEEALMRGMAVPQDERYGMMRQLVSEIDAGDDGSGKRGGGKKPVLIAVILALVIAGGAIAGVLLSRGGGKEHIVFREDRIGRVTQTAVLYSEPGAGETVTLESGTYFRLIDTVSHGGSDWYQVLVSVDDTLKTYYVEASEAELLDDGSGTQLIEQFR